MNMSMNPRYACFCAAFGCKSVKEMQLLQQNRARWPNSDKPIFLLWNTDRIREFFDQSTAQHFARGTLLGEEDHSLYDAWLQAKYPECHNVGPSANRLPE